LTQPARASSKDRSSKRSARRLAIGLVVIGVVVLLAVVTVVSIVDRLKRAGGPSPRSNIAMLESNADNLRAFGFVGCPTVQQIMVLTPESARTDLLMDTNGIDPWGTPYQVECDPDKVHVFSMGPDRRAGTADDIRWPH
jgi:hypothetical protein